MVHIKPAEHFMGCSLLVGVEAVCFVTLAMAVLTIATCSSTEPIQYADFYIAPEAQVVAASWAFVGIPCAVIAGVGALHRIEEAVRALFFYSCASFVFGLVIPVWFVFTNSLCDLVVHPDLQNQGTAFVCGFANTFVFGWTLILWLVQAYMLFIIWSAAEDIARNPFPELNRYNEALLSVTHLLPRPEEPTDKPPPGLLRKAAHAELPPQLPSAAEARTQQEVDAGVSPRGPPPYPFGPAQEIGGFNETGTPQSFVPSPQQGVRFSSSAPARMS